MLMKQIIVSLERCYFSSDTSDFPYCPYFVILQVLSGCWIIFGSAG